ncbi:MAG: hypothetical protein A3E80_03825 [Chlamydiae bacterium RIFCSPHIGHO2_12_FULL_49_9]|nr:MAG: hypothetical protein A3E80_03825 [Chlamydiae bacterium RIFCSPHIGHO2_12_FULL_49_9]
MTQHSRLPSLFAMWKYISLLLLPFFLFSQELEVRLPTRSSLKPIYLSNLHTDPSQYDWRNFEELRATFEFDLNAGGYFAVASRLDDLESTFRYPEVRAAFNLAIWKKQPYSHAISIQVAQNRFSAVVFDISKGTSKKYPEFALSGNLDSDRRHIHRLADAIHKDLTGVEGIASLKILYAKRMKNPHADGPEWHSEIWVCDSDGANARQVTNEKGYCMSPGFFPKEKEGADFYYVTEKNGQSKICRSRLSDAKGEVWVSLKGNQLLPSVSQKGNQVAFITDAAGRPDLFVQNIDSKGDPIGKARQLFSAPRATQASSTYSPDGEQIAFVSDKDGPPRIYLMSVGSPKQTSKPRPALLTKKNRENTSPSWSPDGTKLAYSAKLDGVRQIWIYDFKTEEEYPLTASPENKENPAWAPDSLHLIYNTEGEDACELYLVNVNHPEPILINKTSGQKRFPTWETR